MANISQPNLILFEQVRRELNYIPPVNSNEVFKINEGIIVLQTINDEPDEVAFNLRIQNKLVNTGNGVFTVSRNIHDMLNPYKYIYINSNSTLSINDMLNISNPDEFSNPDPIALSVDGILDLNNNSTINIDNSIVNINKSGIINIGTNTTLSITGESRINVYGTITIPYSEVSRVMSMPQITMFNDTIVNITGLPNDRLSSLTDYVAELRNSYQNINTIGSKYISGGFARITYYWRDGDPSQPSDVLSLVVEMGNAILGDFNLSCVGMPQVTEPYLQAISNITINRIATLSIVDNFDNNVYISPSLYLTKIVGNSSSVGSCIVEGAIVVSGDKSSIKLDRGGYIDIKKGGTTTLTNGGFIENTNNDDEPSLLINGKLIIDDISQLRGFNPNNITFGPDGKLIILNTNLIQSPIILFSTPIGIESSDLYFLFKDRLDKVEYHIQNNDGIRIDKYDNGYNLSDWYGGMRLEKAVKLGYIIWHEGAFIELDKDVVPWVDDNPTLEKVGNLFNVYGDSDKDKLQNAVIRLIYAGFNSIVFRFIANGNIKDLTLTLIDCRIKSAFFNNGVNRYQIATNNPGLLFIRNNTNSANIDELINTESKVININTPDRMEFIL